MIKDMDIKRGYKKIIKKDEITIISRGCSIKGDVQGDCDIKIAGIVNGNVITTGEVITEEGSLVRGNIDAPNVHVKGEVYGDISVSEGIILDSKSMVEGSMAYKTLSVERGAFFRGTCSVLQANEEAVLSAEEDAESV